jgi:hypothetical protein
MVFLRDFVQEGQYRTTLVLSRRQRRPNSTSTFLDYGLFLLILEGHIMRGSTVALPLLRNVRNGSHKNFVCSRSRRAPRVRDI